MVWNRRDSVQTNVCLQVVDEEVCSAARSLSRRKLMKSSVLSRQLFCPTTRRVDYQHRYLRELTKARKQASSFRITLGSCEIVYSA